MATESSELSEGNITAFRALVRHLNEANRVAEGDADFITLQEIPGGGSSSEQVCLSFLIAVTCLINYIIVC